MRSASSTGEPSKAQHLLPTGTFGFEEVALAFPRGEGGERLGGEWPVELSASKKAGTSR